MGVPRMLAIRQWALSPYQIGQQLITLLTYRHTLTAYSVQVCMCAEVWHMFVDNQCTQYEYTLVLCINVYSVRTYMLTHTHNSTRATFHAVTRKLLSVFVST